MAEKDAEKPGLVDRLRARYAWFDHVMRAQERYRDSKGDFFAAGITYFTVFALFPLLMVAFAIAGFVLSRQPDLLADIDDKIKQTVSGDLGRQLVELIDARDRFPDLGRHHRPGNARCGRGWAGWRTCARR